MGSRPSRPKSYDESAVERCLQSDPPGYLHPADRVEVTRILTARGYSAREIAERMHCAERTVFRIRVYLRGLS